MKTRVGSASIRNAKGEVIFHMDGITIPEGWSQMAADICAYKYLRKARDVPASTALVEEDGVPPTLARREPRNSLRRTEDGDIRFDYENGIDRLMYRVAGAWAYWGWRFGYFEHEGDAIHFRKRAYESLMRQIYAPNSPQLFNTGIHWSYGINGGAGTGYCFNEVGSLSTGTTAMERPYANACYIQNVEDSLESIMDLWARESKIFKYGAGSGVNYSDVRGKGEPLSNGGYSSGVISFLKVGDASSGAIKSGGTTRRSARMVVLDIDHPDILEFIRWKPIEEYKVAAMAIGSRDIRGSTLEASDYTPELTHDWQGEAYQTVSAQNANNSISVTDEFMRAVKSGGTHKLKYRTSGLVAKEVRAGELWDEIAMAAWWCADPGLQFVDTMNAWHTCPEAGRIRATNPCSEFVWIDNSSCNLASINLLKFIDEDGVFNAKEFASEIDILITALDISVSMGQYPTKEIAINSWKYRTLGLGYCNLGALLMAMGLPYDSDEGRSVAAAITCFMTARAYLQSMKLAQVVGSFPGWDESRESMRGVLLKHSQNAGVGYKNASHVMARSMFAMASEHYAAVFQGDCMRNAQVTLIAPTGTISLIMDCDTSGIEPEYALVKTKSMAGGGKVDFRSTTMDRGLRTLGYTNDHIREITDHILAGKGMSTCPHLRGKDKEVFHCAMPSEPGGGCISPIGHVKMVAAVQPHVSGGISKTVNLPANATVEDIKRIYMAAWELGVKCISVYRDGSKHSQPLNSASKEPTGCTAATPKRRKLPGRRSGYTRKAKVAGNTVYIRTGEYEDGRLGEIFIDAHRAGSSFRSMTSCFAIAVSLGLQHGVPLEEFVDAFRQVKFEPSGVVSEHEKIKFATSILDYIFTDLQREYLSSKEEPPDVVDVPNGELCPYCGSWDMTVSGTCYKCNNCGSTTGCS